jgi:CelD/BcsL family acetyltransferase involved in cellulose biosynthesis/predicted ATP-grasp superfamily ATP-dependent carboligase
MKVLVTDGDNRAALAVTRSLGRAGHDVIVAATQRSALAQSSRYCAHRAIYPDPVTDPDRFVETTARLAHTVRADCIVPIADITMFMITRNRDLFEPRCKVPFATADIVERAADKVRLVQLAKELDVPVPRSVVVTSAGHIPAHSIPFPLIVKPWRSRIRTNRGWASTSVSHAATPEALERDLRGRGEHEFPVMLQERIEGPGVGVFACYRDGNATALFSHRRLRERPPWGGVSVLCESVELPRAASKDATRILGAIGWTGVAMVEFKVDRRDNQAKLMEVNGRFWGSLQLAIDSGVDFPTLLLSPTPGAPAPYRLGVRSRWFWGDFDALLQTLRPSNGPADLRLSRSRALWHFARFVGSDLHYDNPKWDDPWPFAVETGQRLGAIADVLTRRSDRRTAVPRDLPNAGTPSTSAVRVATTLAESGFDAQTWNALASQAETNSVFQTYQWAHSWIESFNGVHEPFMLVAEVAGAPLAIAPLAFNRSPGLLDRTVSFIGSGRADYCDFLVPRSASDAAGALVDRLLDHGGWDVIDLANIPETSSTLDAVRKGCAARGLLFDIQEQYRCPTLMVAGHENEAQAMLHKPSLQRCRRRIQRAGRLVERVMTTADEVEPRLPEFFAQHIARWGRHSPSLFYDERNRDFYKRLTRALDGSGWLLFSSLEVDGRAAAFHYGFDYNGSVLWYKPSFDPAMANLSPGNVMVSHLIDYTIRHRRRELDFTVGDEPFKRRFTNMTRKTMHLRVYRNWAARLRALTRDLGEAATRARRPEGIRK